MAIQRVMVLTGGSVLTYETDKEVSIGDRVSVPYGSWDAQALDGIIVALGSTPRVFPNGKGLEPAYSGPCKSILAVAEGDTESDLILIEWRADLAERLEALKEHLYTVMTSQSL